jgi:deaminated glutathione amidase
MTTLLAAAVQMTSTADVERNLDTAERLVDEAAAQGARFVALPENFGFLRAEGEPIARGQALDGAWVTRMAGVARRHGLTLLLGSLPEAIAGEARVHNTSVLLGPGGETLAVYRKVHLFDVDLPGMEHLKESKAVRPGTDVVVADTAFGRLGLSICYDLRFPELYRRQAAAGARVLAVPSAFTARTGQAHWEVLLRARAIENLAYVIAPAQWGQHNPRRASHGDAMIVDPWGVVLARRAEGEGVVSAEIDFERQERMRRELPALTHVRLGPSG